MARGRPGSAPQTEKREWFARLIAQGVSDSQAWRIVGVNRKTGKRWRHGRTITRSSGKRLHYPPVINVRKREISPRYLSEGERVRIADLHRASRGVREIVVEVDRVQIRLILGFRLVAESMAYASPRHGWCWSGGEGEPGKRWGNFSVGPVGPVLPRLDPRIVRPVRGRCCHARG